MSRRCGKPSVPMFCWAMVIVFAGEVALLAGLAAVTLMGAH